LAHGLVVFLIIWVLKSGQARAVWGDWCFSLFLFFINWDWFFKTTIFALVLYDFILKKSPLSEFWKV
jgi:hypothetical protein